jgi:hypothetical protein
VKILSEIENYMDENNSKKIWTYIQEAGDKLVGKLSNSRNHPKGRNPYAHVAICVKSKFGQSYKEIPDDKYQEVIEFIDFLVENPN